MAASTVQVVDRFMAWVNATQTRMAFWPSENDSFFFSEGSIVGKLTLRPGVKTVGKIMAQFLTQVSDLS